MGKIWCKNKLLQLSRLNRVSQNFTKISILGKKVRDFYNNAKCQIDIFTHITFILL